MSNPPKVKGTGYENEIRDHHIDLGVGAERVPRSGAEPGYPGDVKLPIQSLGDPLLGECKRRKGTSGFATIKRWLGPHDILFTRADHDETFVHMRLTTWDRVVKELMK